MDRVGSPGGGVTGPSSSVMVPVAVPSAMVAPTGLLRVTVKVSISSSTVSSVVWIEMVFELSFVANVSVVDDTAV